MMSFAEFCLELQMCILNTAALRIKTKDELQRQLLKNQEIIMISNLSQFSGTTNFEKFLDKYEDWIKEKRNDQANIS